LGKLIMVVESGIPVIPFEQSLLLRREHEIIRISTGEEALMHLKTASVDLLISDERLSDMDAADLAARVRDLSNCGSVSIMILGTPSAASPTNGANLFLPKPVVGRDFEEACKKLLSVESRKEVRLLVYVQVQGYLQSNLFLCNSVNLSASGILLLTARRLKKGETVLLQITLPREREKIRVTGEVVRDAQEVGSRLNAYGVRFTVINPEDQERIRKFIYEESRGR